MVKDLLKGLIFSNSVIILQGSLLNEKDCERALLKTSKTIFILNDSINESKNSHVYALTASNFHNEAVIFSVLKSSSVTEKMKYVLGKDQEGGSFISYLELIYLCLNIFFPTK